MRLSKRAQRETGGGCEGDLARVCREEFKRPQQHRGRAMKRVERTATRYGGMAIRELLRFAETCSQSHTTRTNSPLQYPLREPHGPLQSVRSSLRRERL